MIKKKWKNKTINKKGILVQVGTPPQSTLSCVKVFINTKLGYLV